MNHFIKKLRLLPIILAACSISACATDKSEKLDIKPDELKRMSTFVSNFTEVGLMDFNIETIEPTDLLQFGIWHNYKNNYKSRIAQCKIPDCKYGMLVIDGKYIAESIKKYFDIDFVNSNDNLDGGHYDGEFYHFDGADGDVLTQARVREVSGEGKGLLKMTGDIYSIGNDGETDTWGSFEAHAKPYKYDGKDTWSIVSMQSGDVDEYRIRRFGVGPYLLDEPIPDQIGNYTIKKEMLTKDTEEGPYEYPAYVVTENGQNVLNFGLQYDYEAQKYIDDVIGEITIFSDKYKTDDGIGVNSTIGEFLKQYPNHRVWYTYVTDMFVIECKELGLVQFILDGDDYKGSTDLYSSDMVTLKASEFNKDGKIKEVRIYSTETDIDY